MLTPSSADGYYTGCLQLFAIGGDGRGYRVSQTEANGAWGSWINMGSPFVFDALPESATDEAKRFAVVFDFDKDSCYPSPAVSVDKAESKAWRDTREVINLGRMPQAGPTRKLKYLPPQGVGFRRMLSSTRYICTRCTS